MIYDKQETYPDTPPDASNGFRVMPWPVFYFAFHSIPSISKLKVAAAFYLFFTAEG